MSLEQSRLMLQALVQGVPKAPLRQRVREMPRLVDPLVRAGVPAS